MMENKVAWKFCEPLDRRPTRGVKKAEIERLRAMVSWIETYEPELVDAAEAKFGPPSGPARPASRR